MSLTAFTPISEEERRRRNGASQVREIQHERADSITSELCMAALSPARTTVTNGLSLSPRSLEDVRDAYERTEAFPDLERQSPESPATSEVSASKDSTSAKRCPRAKACGAYVCKKISKVYNTVTSKDFIERVAANTMGTIIGGVVIWSMFYRDSCR